MIGICNIESEFLPTSLQIQRVELGLQSQFGEHNTIKIEKSHIIEFNSKQVYSTYHTRCSSRATGGSGLSL